MQDLRVELRLALQLVGRVAASAIASASRLVGLLRVEVALVVAFARLDQDQV